MFETENQKLRGLRMKFLGGECFFTILYFHLSLKSIITRDASFILIDWLIYVADLVFPYPFSSTYCLLLYHADVIMSELMDLDAGYPSMFNFAVIYLGAGYKENTYPISCKYDSLPNPRYLSNRLISTVNKEYIESCAY